MPDDFEQVLIRIGRHLCPEWYGVHRRSIDRWIEQCGKERLLRLRREFVMTREEERRKQRELDLRMRAAIRDKYASAAADLTIDDDGEVGCDR